MQKKPLTPKIMKKQLLLVSLLLHISIFSLKAWDLLKPVGAATSALGGNSVTLRNFWSCLNNPAGIVQHKYFSIGFHYENRFMLKELSYKNAGIILPLNNDAFSLSISQFGYNLYNENIFGLAYAKLFGNRLSVGLKLDYILIKYNNIHYDNINLITFELGIQTYITEKIILGAYIFNPANIKIRSPNIDKIPIIMRLGLSYNITPDFLLVSEVEENFDNNLAYRFGIEYEIIEKFHIRSGFQLNPALFTIGMGLDFKRFSIDFSSEMGQYLGTSLQCSFSFNIKDKKT